MPKKFNAEDIVGTRINKLTVIRREEPIRYAKYRYRCKCDCGKTITFRRYDLLSNRKISCGCMGGTRQSCNIKLEYKRGQYHIYFNWRECGIILSSWDIIMLAHMNPNDISLPIFRLGKAEILFLPEEVLIPLRLLSKLIDMKPQIDYFYKNANATNRYVPKNQ